MATFVELPGVQSTLGLPEEKPLNEAVWRAWIAKTRAQDRRGCELRSKAVKWIAIAALLVAEAVGSHLAPYHVVIRFMVAAGALTLLIEAGHAHRYAFVVAFGALAVLYNPVLPVFTFSGAWQFALIAASTLPFAASLAWRNGRPAQHD